MLDDLGYTDFRVYPSRSDTEIEFRARHRANTLPVFCKCQAIPRSLGPEALKKFQSALAREKKKDRKIIGIFLAFSELSPTGRAWYVKSQDRSRIDFHMFGVDKVAAILRRAKLITSPETLDAVGRARVHQTLGPRYLAFMDGRFYWVQTTLTGRKLNGFMVLDAHGEPVSRAWAREVKRLDGTLEGKRLIDLQLREKILLSLLDLVKKNIEDLAKDVRDAPAAIREAVQDLSREETLVAEQAGLPRWKYDKYSLRLDLNIFLSLARQFLDGPHRFRFLGSRFAGRLLDAAVPAYLESRLKLRPQEMDRFGLMRALAASPSALQHALFAPTDRYQPAAGEAEARSMSPDERDRARAAQLNRLQADVLARMVNDMENPHFYELLAAKGVKAHLLRATAKAGTINEAFFSLHAEVEVPLGRPTPGRTGETTPPSEAEFFVDHGTALMHMKEYDLGLQQFDRGIRGLKDPTKLVAAWDHRGVCLLPQRKFTEAITCFNEAIRYNSNSKQAWYHKAICLKELGDLTGATRCVRRALEIDPAYAEAKEFLRTI